MPCLTNWEWAAAQCLELTRLRGSGVGHLLDGGARGLTAGVSQDGGASWTVVALPFSACAAGSPADLRYERASDPWVSFGPGAPGHPTGATAYAVSISFNQSPGRNGNTVGATVSYDGGLSWRHAQSLRGDAATEVPLPVPDSNFQYFHDKESVTADPTRPGRAYVVWDVLIGPNPRTGDLYVVWQDARFSGHDEIVISTSGDGGATWTEPKRVSTPTGQPAFTAAVAVSSSGTIGVSYYQLAPTSPGSMPTRSVLKTFSRSRLLSDAPNSVATGVGATLVGGPFNMLDAPFALGYFTGDYEALAASGDGFVPVFVQGTCGSSLTCRALTAVTPPADRMPTGNNATDVFAGTGF
jgi:hypothetical protein